MTTMDAIRLRYYPLLFLLRSSKGYVRNSLANVIKGALGREPYLDQSEIVFRAYARHRLGLGPRPKMTSRSLPGEGGGSQVRLTMCAMNFAKTLGFTYLHTPFAEIHHADRPMGEWVRAWEEEFNLGAGEILAEGEITDVFDFARMYSALARSFGFRRFYALFDTTAIGFQEKYYLNKTRRKNPTLAIAVHVRRGDAANKEDTGKWTEMTAIANTVRQLKAVLEGRNQCFRIAVFSDSDGAEFRVLEDLGAELFLRKDALWTLRELVEADILVMGKGFFTYIAAILSDGVRLFDPWGQYPPLKGWVVRKPNGDFDARAFARALTKMKGQ